MSAPLAPKRRRTVGDNSRSSRDGPVFEVCWCSLTGEEEVSGGIPYPNFLLPVPEGAEVQAATSSTNLDYDTAHPDLLKSLPQDDTHNLLRFKISMLLHRFDQVPAPILNQNGFENFVLNTELQQQITLDY